MHLFACAKTNLTTICRALHIKQMHIMTYDLHIITQFAFARADKRVQLGPLNMEHAVVKKAKHKF